MPSELIERGRKWTLPYYLFLQVGDVWITDYGVSEQEWRKKFLCVAPSYETYPSQIQASPLAGSCVLMLPPRPSPFRHFSGFPPIPGLEPSKGTEEDSVAATMATAQKLASEDAALVDEDAEVWLWTQDFRAWLWGERGRTTADKG